EGAPVEEGARGGRQAGGERAGAGGRLALGRELVGGHEPVAEDGDAEAVERDGHRVRGEVAGARPGPRAGEPLELVELAAGEEAALLAADRFPHVLDRDPALADPAGAHRAA